MLSTVSLETKFYDQQDHVTKLKGNPFHVMKSRFLEERLALRNIYMDGLTDVSFISRLKIIYLMHSNFAVSMTKVKITVFTILRRKAPKSKIFKKAFRSLITPDV